jgi:hypothetical protein
MAAWAPRRSASAGHLDLPIPSARQPEPARSRIRTFRPSRDQSLSEPGGAVLGNQWQHQQPEPQAERDGESS